MSILATDDDEKRMFVEGVVEKKPPKSAIYGDLNRFIPDFHTTNLPHIKFPLIQKCLDEEVRFGYTFLWFPIFLIAGAYFNFTRQNDIPTFALIIPFCMLFAVRVALKDLSNRAKYIVGLGIACLTGAIVVNFEQRNEYVLLDQAVTTSIYGVVISREIGTNDMPRYKVELLETSNPKIYRSPKVVQLVARSFHQTFEIGEQITGRARLSPPSGPVFPGGYDFSMAAMRNNVGAYGFFYGKPIRKVMPAELELSFKTRFQLSVNRVRSEIAHRIRQELDGDAAAISSALIVSDRRAISKSVVESLRAAGLAHVLAISGLHMVLASGTFFFALRFLLSLFPTLVQSFPVKKIAALGAIIAASSYLAISGAPISAQRAWIMLVIVLVAVLMDRPAITLRNVAIAAVFITIISPSAVMTPGFQMSFSAAAALVAVYTGWANFSGTNESSKGPVYSGVTFVVRFIMGLAATAIIAGLATGIFAVQHFHQFAGYGVLGNVLAMPIVTILVMPLALISVLLMPFSIEAWPLIALGWSIELVVVIAEWVANLGSNIAIGKPSPIVGLVATVGFIVFICFRSKLRFAGLALVAISALGLFLINPTIPDILISEDGKLVGVRSSAPDSSEFEINRSRPSKFILDQWISAYNLSGSKPKQLFSRNESKELLTKKSEIFWPEFDEASMQFGFECVSSQFCHLESRGISIITITDQTYLEQACQRADIVILSARLKGKNDTCDKSIIILDQNSLRRTGALALYRNTNKSSAAHADWNIVSAINDSARPWTAHRYYDWRSRTYKMPSGEIIKYQPKDTETLKAQINDSDE